MLEVIEGIPSDLLVEAHGSFRTIRCMDCNGQEENTANFWNEISADLLPTCNICGGIMRPNIVMFGEPLTARFMDFNTIDFKHCDLLIVMGTSLVVYPFGGLVNYVEENVPRLLINKVIYI